MNKVKFGFIGWCKEGTSDKIWGWLSPIETWQIIGIMFITLVIVI